MMLMTAVNVDCRCCECFNHAARLTTRGAVSHQESRISSILKFEYIKLNHYSSLKFDTTRFYCIVVSEYSALHLSAYRIIA